MSIPKGRYFICSAATGTVVTATTQTTSTPPLVGSKLSYDLIDQQLWIVRLARAADNAYTITQASSSQASNSYVADLKGANGADGTPIITFPHHGKDNQLWVPTSVSDGFQLRNMSSGDLMDLAGANPADGTAIINYQANGGKNQTWQFKRVGPI